MTDKAIKEYVSKVLENIPKDWLKLTTHRLDIYNEARAKTEFLEHFEQLYREGKADEQSLAKLPTAFDYIRLGHPLSCVLEWAFAKKMQLTPDHVISFSSETMPILAVLRKNKLDGIKTLITYAKDALPESFDVEILRKVYGYDFELQQVSDLNKSHDFDGCIISLLPAGEAGSRKRNKGYDKADFHVQIMDGLGSIITVNQNTAQSYVPAIQHVRRRETIAMTPSDTYTALKHLIGDQADGTDANRKKSLDKVKSEIKKITHSNSEPLVASSGLSIQYAIMMGLVQHAKETHPGKPIRIIVPPNCYGGTNDQARRVAAAIDQVEILDLPVDGKNDMVNSTKRVLAKTAELGAVPLIIAEIPTNPRVEVPDLDELRAALSRKRNTTQGKDAIPPIFILDQTFCPNYNFLGEGQILSDVLTISYVSGSKFPSGGRCTAGYCTTNQKAGHLLEPIEKNLKLCDNEATDLQLSILAEQLPSMNQRIADAYSNTQAFVNFIRQELPEAKINFVSKELAEKGFTPSVFSLDLPTNGNTPEEREEHKRELNHKLITMMITQIPNESKYCVSYGQLKGSYWTIPATSTQGTTKEEDKDYIARVSMAPEVDLERHKEVFKEFVEKEI